MTVDVDIDTRLRNAGESLRQASHGLTAPTAAPDPAGGHRRAALVAIAAVVVAALGLAAVLVREGGTDHVSTEPTTPATTAADPRWSPTVVPEGLTEAAPIDLPTAPDPVTTQHITLYGDPRAADPLAGPVFAIRVLPEGLGQEMPPGSSSTVIFGASGPGAYVEDVEVRGHPGHVGGSPDAGLSVMWEEGPGSWLAIDGRGLDREQLLAIAEALSVDGRNVRLDPLPPGLPGVFEEIRAADVAWVDSAPVPAGLEGQVLPYPGPDGRSLTVATYAGDAADLALLRWVIGAYDEATVAGEPAWSWTVEPASDLPDNLPEGLVRRTRTLVWQAAPGVLAVTTGRGLTDGEVLAAAESLRPA
jgi:hypothetical protein